MELSSHSGAVVTHQNWFQRMGSSLCGLCVGLILIPVSIALVSWNEHDSRAQYLTLEEGRAAVQNAPSDKSLLSPSALYLVSGPLGTSCVLEDRDLGIRVDGALLLERAAEKWQVKEHKHSTTSKTAGGGETTTTTYSYSEDWSSSLIASSHFHDRSLASANPSSWRYGGPGTMRCSDATIDELYHIGASTIESIASGSLRSVDVHDASVSEPARQLEKQQQQLQIEQADSQTEAEDGEGKRKKKSKKGKAAAKPGKAAVVRDEASNAVQFRGSKLYIHGNALYLPASSGSDDRSPALQPRVGDEKYTFAAATVASIGGSASVVGGIDAKTGLVWPFKTKGGRPLLLSSAGIKSADELFDDAQSSNAIKTWALRLVGWLLCLIAFNLFFQPLVIAPQLVPVLGDLVSTIIGWGTGMVSFVLATCLTAVVIAIAWVAVRPAVSLSLLVGAASLAVWYFRGRRGKSAATATEASK